MGRVQYPGAEAYLPAARTLVALREAVDGCRGCDLYQNATQAVFGEGPVGARWMLVGEQPGDREDEEGAPFVGPAGKMLDKALFDVGIPRAETYLTNAVKHFKWTPKGKRRIHETPRASEMRACRGWLEAEMDVVKPGLIVALGSTAVASLLEPSIKVMKDRGRIVESNYGPCLVTVHPSSLLRVEEPDERAAAYEAFLDDLRAGVLFLARVA